MCRVRPALGSFVAFEVEAPSPAAAAGAIDAAFAVIRRVEERMHPTRPGSDLVALGAARGGTAVALDPWTWEVLVLARRLGRLSEGVFDPCVDCPPGALEQAELDAPRLAVPRLPLRLDLGGIAKGYAVDRAVDVLIAAGCTDGIVNAGGDLRVFGRPRAVLLRTSAGAARTIHLHEAALAASDPLAQAPPPEHRGYYLRGARQSDLHQAAAVIAPSAAMADALAKIVLLDTPARWLALLEHHGAVAVDMKNA